MTVVFNVLLENNTKLRGSDIHQDWYFIFSIEIKICGSDKDDCHKYAKCADTGPGEHECTCIPGYSGDGKICKGSWVLTMLTLVVFREY